MAGALSRIEKNTDTEKQLVSEVFRSLVFVSATAAGAAQTVIE